MPHSASFELTVELTAWVTALAGGPASGTMRLKVQVPTGCTVGEALRQAAQPHPQLAEALWVPGQAGTSLNRHIEVIVNDSVLDLHHHLDSVLQPGDHITLTGQFAGG